MTKAIAVLVGLLVAVSGGMASARGAWTPPEDTITGVTGTRHHGFHVRYLGLRDAHLPTLSEAMAECGEYDERLRRLRCRVRMRTWYRDLGDTKRALWHAHRPR